MYVRLQQKLETIKIYSAEENIINYEKKVFR